MYKTDASIIARVSDLSDATEVNGKIWADLKDFALEADHEQYDFFKALSESEKMLIQALI